MTPRPLRTRRVRLLALALVAVLAAAAPIALDATGALDRAEILTVDWRFQLRGVHKPPSDIVVGPVDAATLNRLQTQVPLDRRLHARAIKALRRAGVKTIAYDIDFAERARFDARTDEDFALADAADKA